METRLKIAVQKSGRLLDDSLALLKECGISVDNGRNQLKASARNFPIDILYLRNGDIPQYVQDGVADVGIIGQNTMIEKGKKV
jgi:ATP phosphoribosyltransferase